MAKIKDVYQKEKRSCKRFEVSVIVMSCDSFHISSVVKWQKVRDTEQTGCQKFGLVDSGDLSLALLNKPIYSQFKLV